ncbi:DNA-binding response regulator [candidate division KSB1 bacterium]|nr:MAG: DNA-binding response regulator [candidate division KSB1 bacterium]
MEKTITGRPGIHPLANLRSSYHYHWNLMNKIKALIIDDEELGRKIIREYLESHPEVEVMAECRDAHHALEAIEKYHPDLLFLDVQMPEINGFELLEMLEEIPYVIFSTAYDQYALKAFEVNAVDYLLKPFDQERFDIALERVKKSIQHLQYEKEKIENLLKNLHPEKKYLDRMLVKQLGKIIILNTEEINWIEAMEDYVNLHTARGDYLVLQSLSNLETKLDPNRFIRVHRSYIVNIDAIREIEQWPNSRYKLHLQDGHQITLSRSGAKRLKKLMI